MTVDVAGYVRAIARRFPTEPVSVMAGGWFQILSSTHPNQRAMVLLRGVSGPALDADAAAFRSALDSAVSSTPPPATVTALQIYCDQSDGASYLLELQGFAGELVWSTELEVQLPAFHHIDTFAWETGDDPWSWAFAAGCFGLLTARSIGPFLGQARQIASCLGCSGEQLLLGTLRDTGMVFLTPAEEASPAR